MYIRVPFPGRILSGDEEGERLEAGVTGGGGVDQAHEIGIVCKGDVGGWGEDVSGIAWGGGDQEGREIRKGKGTFTVHVNEGIWEAGEIGVLSADDDGSCAETLGLSDLDRRQGRYRGRKGDGPCRQRCTRPAARGRPRARLDRGDVGRHGRGGGTRRWMRWWGRGESRAM